MTENGVSRRSLLRAAGIGAAVMGGGSLLEACGSSLKGSSASSGSGTKDITIAFIHPLTGDLAEFGTADNWIVKQIQATSQFRNGIKAGGKTYKINIVSYDTQSDATIASQQANKAILSGGADLIVTSSTPETANPVSTAAEKLGCPTVCGNVPWQSWYANLGGNPTPGKTTFRPKYVTMYFLGVNDLANCYIAMWKRIKEKYDTSSTVGWPVVCAALWKAA